MRLDRNQGIDEQGRTFGYVCGEDGGWFFTHLETIDATIESLDEDNQDGDGEISRSEAAEFLRTKLSEKPLDSFSLEPAE